MPSGGHDHFSSPGKDSRPQSSRNAAPSSAPTYRNSAQTPPPASRNAAPVSTYSNSYETPPSAPVPRNTAGRPGKHYAAPAPPNAKTVHPEKGRLIKALICVPIAAALVLGIVWFFEIDLSNMDGYVNTVINKIHEVGMFEEAAPQLAAIAVYGLAVMILLSAYMLPARLSKTIYKTCTVHDKVKITIAGYFVIALSIYLKIQVFGSGTVGQAFSLLFRVHGADRLKVLFAKFASFITAIAMYFAVSVVIPATVGFIRFGTACEDGTFLRCVVARTPLLLLAEISACTLCFIIAMLCKKPGIAVIVNMLTMMTANIGVQIVAGKEWGMNVLKYLPQGQKMLVMGDMSNKNCALALTVCIAFAVLVFAASYAKFRKEELK
jgi:hypothetical protein